MGTIAAFLKRNPLPAAAFLFCFLAGMCLLFGTGCAPSIYVTPDHITVDHGPGNTVQFQAKDGGGNTIQGVTWSCDPSVGTVTESGLFTATGWGTCNLTASKSGYLSGRAQVQVTAPNYLSGTLASSMTLTKQYNPYILSGTVVVPAGVTLTITPGTVVKAQGGAMLQVEGTLISVGTTEEPITFTSIKDDSVCGDTNNDGSATSPSKGDWANIYIKANAQPSRVEFTNTSYAQNAVSIDGGTHQIKNCQVKEMSSDGISIGGGVQNITNNTINNCTGYAVALGSSSPNNVENNTGSGNGRNGIQVSGAYNADCTWNNTNNYLPYVLSGLVVPVGTTLTIEPGVVVKAASGCGLEVNGALISLGTADTPITFTSIKDDTICGDTNSDGSATSPAKGDWSKIYIKANDQPSRVERTNISYAENAVSIEGGTHQIKNCQVKEMSSDGIEVYSGSQTISSDTIVKCTGAAISLADASPTGVTNNTSQNCGINGISVYGTYSSDTVWHQNTNMPYVITNSPGLTIPTGVALTVLPGTVIKSGTRDKYVIRHLKIYGVLDAQGTQENNIYFTSLSNDEIGGDTNGDGSATSPSTYYGGRVDLASASPSTLSHVDISYGGMGAVIYVDAPAAQGNGHQIINCHLHHVTTGISINAGSPKIRNCVIEDGSYHGIVSTGSAQAFEITGCQIKNFQRPDDPQSQFYDASGIELLAGSTPLIDSNLIQDSTDCINTNAASSTITITNNTMEDCHQCISTDGGNIIINGNVMEKIDISQCGYPESCINIDSANSTITSNTIYDCGWGAIHITEGSSTINGNSISEGRGGVSTGSNATVYGNNINNCSAGISTSGNSTVTNNTIYDLTGSGIYIKEGSPTITGNSISGCGSGICESGSSTITGNSISGCGYGIYEVRGGTITGNSISGCYYGIFMLIDMEVVPCPRIIINGNAIFDNIYYGMFCFGPDVIDASENWWGDPTGPAPYGNGNAVYGPIDVVPWVGMEEWYGRRNGENPYCPNKGEPVNVNTGDYSSSHTDLEFASTGPQISIDRTYNSLACDTDGPFGYGWSYTYSARLVQYPYKPEDMKLVCAEGAFLRYISNGNGTYHPEDEDYSLLTHNPDGTWVISHKDGSWEKFDSSGLISQMADTNGNILGILRDERGKVISVTDALGQTAHFFNNTQGRIDHVTDPAGRAIRYTYDLNGNLTNVTDLNGGVTTYTYDAQHRVITVADPKGKQFVVNTYDDANRVISQKDGQDHTVTFSYDVGQVHNNTFKDARGYTTSYQEDSELAQTGETDPQGKSLAITYDDKGNVTSRTDKRGKTTHYTYDENGNMLTETDPLNNTTVYTYNDKGNCLTETDPLGHTITRTYDEHGDMLSETDPTGKTTTYTYDVAGRQSTVTDPLGHTTTNVYDARGNLASVTNPDGGVTTNAYDSANRKTSTTDPEGNTTHFTYDNMGNLLAMTDPEGRTTAYGYDSDGNQTSVTDPLGHAKQTQFDDMGKVSAELDPLGKTTTYNYDPNGNRTQEKDPLGKITSHEYDPLGRETKTTDPRGNPSTKSYDEEGNVITETDAEGNTTTYTYDASGRVSTETDAYGNTTTHTYDAAGRETATTDPSNHTTTNTYDDAGRLTSTKNPDGNTTSYTYDAAANKTSETDPDGNTTLYTYDSMNRLLTTTDPAGRVTSYTYDRNGKKTSTTDGTGATTHFEYNHLGIITKAIDPVGSTVSYSYDAAGRRISMTDPKGAVTAYAYDAANRLTSETNPIGEITSYTYDAAGRTLKKIDGMGTTTYSYDANGNRTRADYPGTLAETATYDKDNRPTKQSGAGVAISLTYDKMGRVTSASNGTAATSAAYDKEGNITGKTLTYPAGSKSFSYTYNNRNLMTGASLNGATTSYTYSASGRITEKDYPNGIKTLYGHDNSGQVTSLQVKKGAQAVKTYQVTRDARANITSITEDATQTTSYTYDAASRLTGEGNPWLGNTTYSYDPDGNRLTKQKQGGPAVTYTYNPADELLSDSQGNTYTYNARGDLVRVDKGAYQKNLTWDGKGRLTSIKDKGNLNETYTYDPLDRTYKSTDNGQATMHVYDMSSDRETATLASNQTLLALFNTGADGLISSTTTQGTSYYSYNPHSDASLITDESGNATSQLHYDAWGNPAEQTNEPFNYLGKYQRRTYSSPGLIKMGARFYDPDKGRFISRDPLKGQDESPISRNLYLYSYDDAVNLKDLSGTSPIGDALRLRGVMYDSLRFHSIAVTFHMHAAAYDALEAGKTPPAQMPQNQTCSVTKHTYYNEKEPSFQSIRLSGWVYYSERKKEVTITKITCYNTLPGPALGAHADTYLEITVSGKPKVQKADTKWWHSLRTETKRLKDMNKKVTGKKRTINVDISMQWFYPPGKLNPGFPDSDDWPTCHYLRFKRTY